MTWNQPVRDFWVEEVVPAHSRLTLETAYDIFNGVTFKTPVDTGRARVSWNLSEGEINYSFPGPGNYPAPISRRLTATRRAKPWATYWVTNALPYIIPLEMGHSRQAPGGMLRTTLASIR